MAGKTLVFGASLKPERYSNLAVHRLRAHGIETLAFGLRSGSIAGVEIDTHLMPYKDIDTVTLYLSPKQQEMYYEYLVALKPRRIIFNPGTENQEFYNLLMQEGIEFEVACTLVLLSTNQY